MQLSAHPVPVVPTSKFSEMFSNIQLNNLLLDSRIVIGRRSLNYFGLASLANNLTMFSHGCSQMSMMGIVHGRSEV